ncbi:MAG: DUF4097 family beta strand repeat-containing protein [Chloroflexota bacterium]
MTTSSSNNRTLIIIAIVVAIVLICCCLAVVALAASGVLSSVKAVTDMRMEASATVERSFDVTTPVTLKVRVNVGQVIVKVGEGDTVRISAVKRVWGQDRQQAEDYLADVQIDIEQPQANRIEIQTVIPARLNRLGRTPSVDLEIWVPRQTDLDLSTEVGGIEVTGVEGAFDVRTNVGDITLRDAHLAGDSQLKTDVGSIDLRLPANSAFTFRAQTDVGDIDLDFDVRNRRQDEQIVGGTVEGEVGDTPTVHLNLKTNTGDIDIRK